ncbi:MAG: flagellar hook protein FlgE [Burkholderiales bacterium]|nr:flagellar hook protein FlgE [Burkholderiales bacterium]MDE2394323.1 flagellar hook protein FlgE [Burkholderiales bacterium]MDE2452489.1 flagellar hook protein FlgE [Burkholderiales bacterium]
MSFQQGLSGLAASSSDLDVIGNNIANANTFGAKSSTAVFADMYANAISGAGGSQVGIGATMATVAQQFTQGTITSTGNPLDVAINGSGFFELADKAGTLSYSRNGQFQLNSTGYIVNSGGLQLMGYPANSNGVIQPGAASPLQLPTAGIAPQVTSKSSLQLNLSSGAAITAPTTSPAINFSDATTYNNATSQSIYDAQGEAIDMTYYFQHAPDTTTGTAPSTTTTNTWNVFATANGTTVSGTTAAPTPLAQVQFDATKGTWVSSSAGNPATVTTPPSLTNAAGVPIPSFSFKVDLSGMTQYGSAFGVTNQTQDGYAPGQLAGITIGQSGIITANYSNGQTQAAGQLELANFRNPQGLQAQSGNIWSATAASGNPIVGVAGQGNLGVLQSGALEASNVDLTGQLVGMITAQRVYQANAQTIKTQDAVMQTLVSLQ